MPVDVELRENNENPGGGSVDRWACGCGNVEVREGTVLKAICSLCRDAFQFVGRIREDSRDYIPYLNQLWTGRGDWRTA